jgi:hypothetical protein
MSFVHGIQYHWSKIIVLMSFVHVYNDIRVKLFCLGLLYMYTMTLEYNYFAHVFCTWYTMPLEYTYFV